MAKTPLIIYHGPSLDGFTGAWVIWRSFLTQDIEAEIFAANYEGKVPDTVGRQVFLVGFCYDQNVMKTMVDEAESIMLFGNHKTAKKDLTFLQGVQIVESRDETSAASLTWKYFFRTKPPLMLQYIEDAYLYHFKLPDSRSIRCALATEERSLGNWTDLMTVDEGSIQPYVQRGDIIRAVRDKDIYNMLKSTKRRVRIGKWSTWMANCPSSFASDACNVLARDQRFAVVYYDSRNHRHFELRSPKDSNFDVERLAKLFGGGGVSSHAAAFKVSRDHPLAKI